jgi:hypothetical protein
MYRINRVSLYGSDTFNDASTSWTAIQENITVNHVGYFAPIQLNQLSTYRYVKVVVWNTDKMYSKYYPIWIIKNFWLGSAE